MQAPKINLLFGSELWTRALESYANACGLTVKLFDAGGRLVFGPVHSTPIFELFDGVPGYEPGLFEECASRCLAQSGDRSTVVVAESYGLSVMGTSLVLDGTIVGAAVGGYAFVDFSQISEIQRLARDAGIRFERLWNVARNQKPVPRGRLLLNGQLLQVLGDALLQENSRTRQYERAVLQLEETARGRNQVYEELQQTAATLRRLNEESSVQLKHEHRVAQAFQDASLPFSLPNVPGLSFDAVYSPGKSEATIGGDWYDAVRLPDGRAMVSIGDVAGSGLPAAVTMASMRQVVRGIAQVRVDPRLMLDAAGRALRLNEPDRFVTAFVGIIDPIAKTLSYASAGHPPAFLRYPSGDVAELSDGGPPLGLRPGHSGRASVVSIPDGATLVLYTDGLTEFQRDGLQGEIRLRNLVSNGAFRDARSPATALKDVFLGDVAARDDVAMLVVEIMGLPEEFGLPPYRWRFHTGDAAGASRAREESLDALHDRGATREEMEDAQIVLSELIGNAVRYAPGPIEIAMDWSASAPVLHVFDRGRGFSHANGLPADPLSESGRGLYLASAFADTFEIEPRPAGGSQARAVLKLAVRRYARARDDEAMPETAGALSR